MYLMKTSIEFSNSFMKEAKSFAKKHGYSLKGLIEVALREYMAKTKKAQSNFKLKNAAYKGNGLQEGVVEGDWSSLRDEIYKGRGS